MFRVRCRYDLPMIFTFGRYALYNVEPAPCARSPHPFLRSPRGSVVTRAGMVGGRRFDGVVRNKRRRASKTSVQLSLLSPVCTVAKGQRVAQP